MILKEETKQYMNGQNKLLLAMVKDSFFENIQHKTEKCKF